MMPRNSKMKVFNWIYAIILFSFHLFAFAGTQWTYEVGIDNSNIADAYYADSLWIVVGENGSLLHIMKDEKINSVNSGTLEDINFIRDNGEYLLLGTTQGQLIQSFDGEVWIVHNTNLAEDFIDGVWNSQNRQWYIASENGIYSTENLRDLNLVRRRPSQKISHVSWSSQLGLFFSAGDQVFNATDSMGWSSTRLNDKVSFLEAKDSVVIVNAYDYTYILNHNLDAIKTFYLGEIIKITDAYMYQYRPSNTYWNREGVVRQYDFSGNVISETDIIPVGPKIYIHDGDILSIGFWDRKLTIRTCTLPCDSMTMEVIQDTISVITGDSLHLIQTEEGMSVWNSNETSFEFRNIPAEGINFSKYGSGIFYDTSEVPKTLNARTGIVDSIDSEMEIKVYCEGFYWSYNQFDVEYYYDIDFYLDTVYRSSDGNSWISIPVVDPLPINELGSRSLCVNNEIYFSGYNWNYDYYKAKPFSRLIINDSVTHEQIQIRGVDSIKHIVEGRTYKEIFVSTSQGVFYRQDSQSPFRFFEGFPHVEFPSVAVNDSIVAIGIDKKLYFRINEGLLQVQYLPYENIRFSGNKLLSWSDIGLAYIEIEALLDASALASENDYSFYSNWTIHHQGEQSSGDFKTLEYGDEKFVALNYDGTLFYSADGIFWDTLSTPFLSPAQLTYIDSIWYLTSYRAGYNWVLVSTDGLHYGNSSIRFYNKMNIARNDSIMVMADGVTFMHSTDGHQWKTDTSFYHPYGEYTQNIVWDGSNFLANTRNRYFLSEDGAHWQENPYPNLLPSSITKIKYLNNKLFAIRYGGIIVFDSDYQWEWASTESSSITFYDIAWNGNYWIAVGEEGVIEISEDGMTWNIVESGTNQDLTSIAVNENGNSVIVGDSAVILYSELATNWNVQKEKSIKKSTLDLQSAAWDSSNGFVLYANYYDYGSKDYLIHFVHPESSWTTIDIPDSDINQVIAVNSVYFTLGDRIYRSENGLSWDTVYTSDSLEISSIVYSPNDDVYLATNKYELLVSYDEAFNWETLVDTFSHEIRSVTWDGDQYTVLTKYGMYTSVDMLSWSYWRNSNYGNLFSRYNDETYLILGGSSVHRGNDLLFLDSMALTVPYEKSFGFDRNEIYFVWGDYVTFFDETMGEWSDLVSDGYTLNSVIRADHRYWVFGNDAFVASRPVNEYTTQSSHSSMNSSSSEEQAPSSSIELSCSSETSNSSSSSEENTIHATYSKQGFQPTSINAFMKLNRLFYQLSSSGKVEIKVFNTKGSTVAHYSFNQTEGNYYLDMPFMGVGRKWIRIEHNGNTRVLSYN